MHTSAHDQKPVALKATKLFKSFYKPACVQILQNTDLTVYAGDSIAIMGRSGEGKSTLLQILGTLDNPCSGVLEIDGEPITTWNKSKIRNLKLGFIFQSFHLLEDYSALENVLMPAKIARKPTSAHSVAHTRAQELLNYVGLSHRMEFNTKLLSGGEKQRVAIARALCNDPQIILADEPSGNLDKQTSDQIHQLLIDLVHVYKKTLIIVTHNHDLAQLCAHNYTLSKGSLEKNK